MSAKTISFVKGKGSLRHNNRDFIADNVDPDRIKMNVTYVKQRLEEAYEVCFGEALREYNEKQTRSDRKKDNYMTEIKNSKNREKVFYENVVQIGTMMDTGAVNADGTISIDAKEAAKILDEYARTFQERNPNLYVFNCVLHMDEATPHLHIDYIPVAHGYKKGIKTRNSLTKALQEMGFDKAISNRLNETVAWQKREREHLTQLAVARGIEIETKGEVRENYTLPEYREAMKAVDALNEEAQELGVEISVQESQVQMLGSQVNELQSQKKELEKENATLIKNQKKEAETLREYKENTEAIKTVKKAVDKKVNEINSKIKPTKGCFGEEEIVKVPRRIYDMMVDVFRWAFSHKKIVENARTERDAAINENENAQVALHQMSLFIQTKNLGEEFKASMHQNTLRNKIKEKQEMVKERKLEQNLQESERTTKHRHQGEEL